MGVPDASDSRLAALTRWLVETLGYVGAHIEPASADASFRRYFRVSRGDETHIVMDAPPEKEDLLPFVNVARSLADLGLNVPLVLARERRQGFLLLTDLGSCQYLDELQAERAVDRLYTDALSALVTLQTLGEGAAQNLPPYNRELLLREMQLLPEWFLKKHLSLQIDDVERDMLEGTFEALASIALSQPQCFVHRDYHSRNLLLCEGANPGILDFQDAVRGPVTYDAVSLLKDCYVAWPAPRVRAWLSSYRSKLLEAGFALPGDAADFERWFDLMGLQRHIKVLGIFARLFYRDGKCGYLKDLPRVLDYTRATAAAYPETSRFAKFVSTRIDPLFAAAQARAELR